MKREYQEKNLKFLRKSLKHNTLSHKNDNQKIMKENVTLLQEINDLNKELHRLKLDIGLLESKQEKMIAFREGRWGGKQKTIDDVEGVFDDILADQTSNKEVQELRVQIGQLSEDHDSLTNQIN